MATPLGGKHHTAARYVATNPRGVSIGRNWYLNGERHTGLTFWVKTIPYMGSAVLVARVEQRADGYYDVWNGQIGKYATRIGGGDLRGAYQIAYSAARHRRRQEERRYERGYGAI